MKLKLSLSILIYFLAMTAFAQEQSPSNDSETINSKDKLVVVWTSGDKEVAEKMVFMYTYNAQKYGWWKDITLLVWGPSAKLLSEDKDLQKYVQKMKKEGVNLLACKGCADQYKISDQLSEIGVTVRYTGKDLTEFIKERHVITF
ncbi:DsrE family protein [Labilibacter marinus]|uniref:DsrE family protein n=1 Tax=Labilibacter marinus TaxID=1477105 RepID=UPI0018E94408|nr:DsrE family protein [Labilibacter marinus]